MLPVKCKGSSEVPLHELKSFQNDLKFTDLENLEKLKRSLLKFGFTTPFFVWATTNGRKNKTLYLLDGHQRKTALNELREDGTVLPDKFPIVEIDAKSKQDAKEKLLAIVSQYGKLNYKTSFFDNSKFDDDFDSSFLALDLDKFDFFKEDEAVKDNLNIDDTEISEDYLREQESKETICPKCGHAF